MFLFILCSFVLSITERSCEVNQPRCMLKLDLSVCYSFEQPNVTDVKHVLNVTNEGCEQNDVCRKEFGITYFDVLPYSWQIVADLLRTCCGNCIRASKVNTLSSVSHVTKSIMEKSHFVFPMLSRSNTRRMFGYHFIPLVEAPSIYYVTAKPDGLMTELIISCLHLWPLVIICLFMVVISGFLGWVMETRANEEEFPRPFLIGWFEGFWWSFISMTTVGYGDKVPKSIPARLFSVLWIFIGIVTFSLVTAMLSSEISKANSLQSPTMTGSKVGALRHRLYEGILIAKFGGIMVDVEMSNTTDGIHKLVEMLRTKEISGFVLDKYTLLLFYRYCEMNMLHDTAFDFFQSKTIRTDITNTAGDMYSYGILVNNTDDYEFLVDFVFDNRDVLNTCNGLLINNGNSEIKAKDIKDPLFSPSGDIFHPAFITVTTIVIFICAFGIFYEVKRKGARFEKTAYLINTHYDTPDLNASF